jgi:hypothetical protein
VTIMSRWPLYKGDRYDRFDCIWYYLWQLKLIDRFSSLPFWFIEWSVWFVWSLYQSEVLEQNKSNWSFYQ